MSHLIRQQFFSRSNVFHTDLNPFPFPYPNIIALFQILDFSILQSSHIKEGVSGGGDGIRHFGIFLLLIFEDACKISDTVVASSLPRLEAFHTLFANSLACFFGQRSRAAAFVSNKCIYKMLVLVFLVWYKFSGQQPLFQKKLVAAT